MKMCRPYQLIRCGPLRLVAFESIVDQATVVRHVLVDCVEMRLAVVVQVRLVLLELFDGPLLARLGVWEGSNHVAVEGLAHLDRCFTFVWCPWDHGLSAVKVASVD